MKLLLLLLALSWASLQDTVGTSSQPRNASDSPYQVLTICMDIDNVHVHDVQYNTNSAQILKYPPETIRVSAITNNDCSPVSKTTTLSKTTRVEKRWDVGGSITAGVKTTFSVGIPIIASGGVEVSGEVTFQASGGHTYVEQVQHSISVKLDVLPNHSCKVRLLGYKYKADIPFTARFTRTYKSGATTSTSISGTYNSVEVGEVQAVVDRCEPVPDARPCS